MKLIVDFLIINSLLTFCTIFYQDIEVYEFIYKVISFFLSNFEVNSLNLIEA